MFCRLWRRGLDSQLAPFSKELEGILFEGRNRTIFDNWKKAGTETRRLLKITLNVLQQRRRPTLNNTTSKNSTRLGYWARRYGGHETRRNVASYYWQTSETFSYRAVVDVVVNVTHLCRYLRGTQAQKIIEVKFFEELETIEDRPTSHCSLPGETTNFKYSLVWMFLTLPV